jgi:hypothetical protein
MQSARGLDQGPLISRAENFLLQQVNSRTTKRALLRLRRVTVHG